jgi:hypothetical protein
MFLTQIHNEAPYAIMLHSYSSVSMQKKSALQFENNFVGPGDYVCLTFPGSWIHMSCL